MSHEGQDGEPGASGHGWVLALVVFIVLALGIGIAAAIYRQGV